MQSVVSSDSCRDSLIRDLDQRIGLFHFITKFNRKEFEAMNTILIMNQFNSFTTQPCDKADFVRPNFVGTLINGQTANARDWGKTRFRYKRD